MVVKRCIWCCVKTNLLHGKPYCYKCSELCHKECKRCHRPFPDKKYFTLNTERCNSCQRKYHKEKLKCYKNVLPVEYSLKHYKNVLPVEYSLLSIDARPPKRATPRSIGYDIYSIETCRIPPGKCGKISTGLSIKFPKGTYGRIADRSGIVWNLGLHVIGGTIDPDEKEIEVILFNLSPCTVCITKGMRIAQIILEKAIVNYKYILSPVRKEEVK